MSTKAVLFDLDGTLLPMDQMVFVKKYLSLLAEKMAPHGYDPQKLVDAIWAGTGAMMKNDGSKRNEEVFWDRFTDIFGQQSKGDLPLFDAFYHNEFEGAKATCGYNPQAAQTIALVKEKGLRTALATNPIFPAVATKNRIRWAGLSPKDFELYTTYENSRYCKPNPAYYMDILNEMDLSPEECVMVGNDVGEDMVTRELGMQVFLLTDCLINKKEADITQYPHGSFPELKAFIENL